MRVVGIIPARYASSRFPGKPLAEILGKPMIIRVVEQCLLANLDEVIVATDNKQILNCVKDAGYNAVMTSETHLNGTERIAEVADSIQAEYILNIQGDEPFIQPAQINQLITILTANKAHIATLIRELTSVEEISSPNVVKCVKDMAGKALYFSRAPIPYKRNLESATYYQHIGIYGFKRKTLLELVKLTSTQLETTESLEQLRWLESGYTIQTAISDYPTYAVDSPSDIEKIINEIKHEDNR